jgi:hypothetical protein
MLTGFLNKIRSRINIFSKEENYNSTEHHNETGERPDRVYPVVATNKKIITPILNRIAVDVASLVFSHSRVDNDNNFEDFMPTSLNRCLTIRTNIDQTADEFFQDVVMSLLMEGSVAIVPVEYTTVDNNITEIYSMRAGKVVRWRPNSVVVRLYNDIKGRFEEVTVKKNSVVIIENPFYSVMNDQSSTLSRLSQKLSILDAVDIKAASNKLDLLLQFPFTVKTELRKKQAKERIEAIEEQLNNSKHGVAYIDATERVIQLNRPVSDTLLSEVESLTVMLNNQLGLTPKIFDGTASPAEMQAYNLKTIFPIATRISLGMTGIFISRTAYTQGQRILYFNNLLRSASVTDLGTLFDSLSRNTIAKPNELRSVLGMKPSNDPNANKLSNKNMPDNKPVDKENP